MTKNALASYSFVGITCLWKCIQINCLTLNKERFVSIFFGFKIFQDIFFPSEKYNSHQLLFSIKLSLCLLPFTDSSTYWVKLYLLYDLWKIWVLLKSNFCESIIALLILKIIPGKEKTQNTFIKQGQQMAIFFCQHKQYAQIVSLH